MTVEAIQTAEHELDAWQDYIAETSVAREIFDQEQRNNAAALEHTKAQVAAIGNAIVHEAWEHSCQSYVTSWHSYVKATEDARIRREQRILAAAGKHETP